METINFEKLKKPYFIAEIGGNHAGEKKFALEGIKNAKKSGADCVKFQMYRAEDLIIKTMPVMQHVKSIGFCIEIAGLRFGKVLLHPFTEGYLKGVDICAGLGTELLGKQS